MDWIYKICATAVLTATAALIIRQIRPDMAIPVRIAGSVTMTAAVIAAASPVISYVNGLFGETGAGAYGQVLLRALGVGFTTHMCATLCRDSGENGLASLTETAGKISILVISLPLVAEIIGGASKLLGLGG